MHRRHSAGRRGFDHRTPAGTGPDPGEAGIPVDHWFEVDRRFEQQRVPEVGQGNRDVAGRLVGDFQPALPGPADRFLHFGNRSRR